MEMWTGNVSLTGVTDVTSWDKYEFVTRSPQFDNMSHLQPVDNYTLVQPSPVDMLTNEQEYQLSLLNYWINGVFTNITVLLGMIGNILTIIILSQRAMRSSTNYYLSALAIWDSAVLICTLLLIGLPGALPPEDVYMTYVFAYIVSYIYPIALIAQTATIWLTVSFTVERYIAVCHPLKAATMCTITRAKTVITGVSIGSTLYNIPRWFDYTPTAILSPLSNTTVVVPSRTAFSQNLIYLQVYFSWLYVPIMCIVPLLILLVLNLFLILAVRHSQRQRKDMNVRQCRENSITIMLVSIVMVFIVCQVPALVYNLAYAVDNAHVQMNFGYQILSNLRNFLVNLNSAVNFILYCALGQKFRRIFIHTFLRRCVRETYMPISGMHQNTTQSGPFTERTFTGGRRAKGLGNMRAYNAARNMPNNRMYKLTLKDSNLKAKESYELQTNCNNHEMCMYAPIHNSRLPRACEPDRNGKMCLDHLIPDHLRDGYGLYSVDVDTPSRPMSV
ncbi:hypothetical protein NP493_960g03004 [Ridgeia piscesae]|uniref:G-protein coupled receptors family 1 profile domain-containing protein n=1 Tax=Ridgeia piscesae TaxID=27915 RepID=A0AAD9KJC5_RIDPI|nr:hypothetical protein NP493_960g03004 [Ridgeia piscesae]